MDEDGRGSTAIQRTIVTDSTATTEFLLWWENF